MADDARQRRDPPPLGFAPRVSTSAAAPSEIELELAAVTVPPSRNAGFSVGILSGLAFGGCSSSATIVSLLPALTVTGAISAAKRRPHRRLGAFERAQGIGVLRLAGELIGLGAIFGEGPHQSALVVGSSIRRGNMDR